MEKRKNFFPLLTKLGSRTIIPINLLRKLVIKMSKAFPAVSRIRIPCRLCLCWHCRQAESSPLSHYKHMLFWR